jgi:hypothetical protein
MMTKARYTVEPGRQIYCDGRPFISIGREGSTRPTEADAVCHVIADMLNAAKIKPIALVTFTKPL